MRRFTRLLLVVGGTIAAATGIAGVFLPLLPTTPFLLLAAALYSRSSERFYRSLLRNRWFGDYIRRYYERRSMTRRHKTFTLVLLWTVLSLSGAFIVGVWWARLLLAIVAVGVTVHLIWIRSE
jgi:uncharacterized membrane protein YbaN (DUF454 family)